MKILLVDDEERSRLHLADFLRKLGHQVLDKGSASEALELLPGSDINLLLTDNRMPGMSGLELMRCVRELPSGQDMDMVIFTAYGDMESSIAAMRTGAFDYLLKPLNIEELVKMIQRVAQRHMADATEGSRNTTTKTENPVLLRQANPEGSYSLQSGRYGEMVVYSKTMREIIALARKLHQNRAIPVLIEGETGTGKELIARYIHYGDEPVDTPFIAINCAAIPESLFESELLGYEGGSFSGSLNRGSKGKIDLAQGGTLFLDEISEIPLNLQAKLLRLIQEREFYRVGGLNLITSNVRIIGASNRNLKKAVAGGSFRQDLYFRLKVGQVYLPPLRQRKDGIIPLAQQLLEDLSRQNAKRFQAISPEAAHILLAYDWPGNIREMRNLLEWVVFTEEDEVLRAEHLSIIAHNSSPWQEEIPPSVQRAGESAHYFDLSSEGMPLDEASNAIILKALHQHQGNKAATARYLGISRSSLYYRLKHMGHGE